MVITLDTIIVGKEKKVSQKGNKYGIVSFMDGTNPIRAMIKDLNLYEKIISFEQAEIMLNVDLRYAKAEVVDWKRKIA